MVIDLALEATRTNPASPPYIINAPVTVMSRSFDGTTWSALTVADFTVEIGASPQREFRDHRDPLQPGWGDRRRRWLPGFRR